MSTVTKPIALDETLKSTNTALGSLGKDTTLQAIATAIANVGLSNIGNLSSLATTDKTSLVSAINEVVGDVSDLDTAKADKVTSATNGNLAGLNGSGNLTDSGWASDKTTTSASGNPISITGLKSNQLAVNPVITFEPIQDLHGQSKPYPAGGGKNLIPMTVDGIKALNTTGTWNGNNYTLNNIIFTLNTDADNNIISIRVNASSAASANALLQFGKYALPSGSYRLENDFANNKAYVEWYGKANTASSDSVSFSVSDSTARNCYIVILSGYTPSNLVFKPLIRLASNPSGFEPYTNICSISGYDKIEALSCGKNLFDGIEQGSWNISNGTKIASTNRCRLTHMYNLGASQYVLSAESNVSGKDALIAVQEYTYSNGAYTNTFDSGWQSSGYSFTTIQGRMYTFIFSLVNNPDVTPESFKKIQLEKNSSATPYVQSNKTTNLSEPLPQTVYGGSLDVRTGKLVSTLKVLDMANMDWQIAGSIFYCRVNDIAQASTLYCSCYKSTKDVISEDYTVSSRYGYYVANPAVILKDSRYNDVTSLKAALTGQVLLYATTSPIEIQLTPHEISLLKDYAYVSTNGTNIALDYHNGEIATLGAVSQLGETVNWLSESTQLEVINIPYSAFSWNASVSGFTVTTSIDKDRLLGFIVRSTNGGAIMNAYYPANSILQVLGFVPKTGTSIDNTYQFVCYAILKRTPIK